MNDKTHYVMNQPQDFLEQVENYVANLLTFHLPKNICYHNLERTRTVVKGAKTIATHAKLTKEQSFILLLAAWFQDIGYLSRSKGHEVLSAKMATNYLKMKKIPSHIIYQVTDCIMATEKGAKPEGPLEHIMQDACLFHLIEGDYWAINGLLRKEMATLRKKPYGHYQWYLNNLGFLHSITFGTDFGKSLLENKRQWHIIANEKLLETLQKQKVGQIEDTPSLFPSKGYMQAIRLTEGSIIRI